MGIGSYVFKELKIGLSSSDVVQKYKRSARNLMVIARMPEDRRKPLKNLQKPSRPYTPRCVHL
eukprot:12627204-Heterocapsa_arctica.AAC.1